VLRSRSTYLYIYVVCFHVTVRYSKTKYGIEIARVWIWMDCASLCNANGTRHRQRVHAQRVNVRSERLKHGTLKSHTSSCHCTVVPRLPRVTRRTRFVCCGLPAHSARWCTQGEALTLSRKRSLCISLCEGGERSWLPGGGAAVDKTGIDTLLRTDATALSCSSIGRSHDCSLPRWRPRSLSGNGRNVRTERRPI
jgi:hypothetical protein